MLRIRQCFKQCGIMQQELASATGWSKSLISRVFSSGELPVDVEKFKRDLATFAEYTPVIQEWLVMHDMCAVDLLKPEGHDDLAGLGLNAYLDGQIDQALDIIFHITGFAAVNGAENFQVQTLAKVSHYLLITLRNLPIGMDALGEIEVEVNRLLQEGVWP